MAGKGLDEQLLPEKSTTAPSPTTDITERKAITVQKVNSVPNDCMQCFFCYTFVILLYPCNCRVSVFLLYFIAVCCMQSLQEEVLAAVS